MCLIHQVARGTFASIPPPLSTPTLNDSKTYREESFGTPSNASFLMVAILFSLKVLQWRKDIHECSASKRRTFFLVSRTEPVNYTILNISWCRLTRGLHKMHEQHFVFLQFRSWFGAHVWERYPQNDLTSAVEAILNFSLELDTSALT